MPPPATLSLGFALLDDGELWQDIPKLRDERVQTRHAMAPDYGVLPCGWPAVDIAAVRPWRSVWWFSPGASLALDGPFEPVTCAVFFAWPRYLTLFNRC